ncbi:MAG TPA: V-type ATPase 116kDa subunit family protein, partial [Sunxiuqinia sp.]|nr:V-type ATPase 116kDa subunit family protein [Sunxiuqinia sp.]
STKKFPEDWLNDYPLEIVYQDSKTTKFVVVGETEKIFSGSHKEYPPKKQLGKLQNEVATAESEIKNTEDQLKTMAKTGWDVLQNRMRHIQVRLDWLRVSHNPVAEVGEGTIQVLEGWVPVSDEEKLVKYLEDNHILYEKTLAEADERPPIKLRNNKFGRLFEPISKLFSLPAYQELDLTIYFAPFFMLFFGFCLGDAGYGLVMLIGATIFKRYANKSMKPFLTLGQLFGLSTLIMGTIFGTFFGMELAKVPAMGNVKDLFLDSSQVFNLSLMVGAVQITYGIILRMRNQLRQEYPLQALSSAGWLLLFVTIGWFSYLWKDNDLSTLWTIVEKAMYVLSIGMILLFSTNGPIHMRVLGGIWEMYGTVTGIFGDLLSYIRLFALGIASSILGLVINQMAVAFGKAPYVGPVIFILIILIGHTGNLAISSLGAFVHPMRLTFVEFYKNAGFKGGGRPYMPFSK